MIETLVNGKWTLWLAEHRARRAEWTGPGWEPERLDSMHEHLTRRVAELDDERRPVIIDVGVEEGDLTALYSLWGCDVIMVEPNPRVWPNVRAIWETNDLRPPLAWWVGFAGDEIRPGSIDFGQHWAKASDGWPVCAHGPVIGDHAFLHLSQHHHVPTTALDALVTIDPARGLAYKVDAITIDTEGSELTVLRGARRILEHCRPLVWVSVHSDQQWMDENYPMDKRQDVLDYMAAAGYHAEWLAQDHEEHWLFRPLEQVEP